MEVDSAPNTVQRLATLLDKLNSGLKISCCLFERESRLLLLLQKLKDPDFVH